MAEGVRHNEASVFGYVDQDEAISRIDTMEGDELASCFFGDSIQDVENAATRMFEIGVGGATRPDEPTAAGPFAVPEAAVQSPPPALPAEASPAVPQQPDPLVGGDTAERKAFILGGPGGGHRP